MGYSVIDIETVPDRTVWMPTPKDQWEKGVEPFPPIWAHRVLCIGGCHLDQDLGITSVSCYGLDGDLEKGILEALGDHMKRGAGTLVTWNGRRFDLPVILLRAMHYGMSVPAAFGKDFRYRFSESGHLDLCDQMSDFGAAQGFNLDNIAKVCGLPGKMGVDGSKVEDMHITGKLDEIRRYCLTDCIQTAFVFMRWRLLSGWLDRAGYHKAAGVLFTYCAEDERFKELAEKSKRKTLLLG